MIRKSLILCATLLISTTLFALDKQALADSLTIYAQQHARVGKVTVSKVQQRNGTATVWTNGTLGSLSLTPEMIKDIHNIAEYFIFSNHRGQIRVLTDDYELSELIYNPSTHGNWNLQPFTPIVTRTSEPYEITNGLNGKQIALWGSHGIYFQQTRENWMWQRAKILTTVEDLYTTSYTMTFLVPMLENAGAVVFQPRERDTQIIEYLLDDEDFKNAKSWKRSEDIGWGHSKNEGEILLEHDNPFCFGHYTQSNAVTDKHNATEFRYTVNVSKPDDYAVYISYKTLPNSAENVQYTVCHKGQKTTFLVNQQMGGGTWLYLGTFAFDNSAENYVSVSNYNTDNEAVITTDAVKIGGGMGTVARFPSKDCIPNVKSSDLKEEDVRKATNEFVKAHYDSLLNISYTSNYPRWIEGSRYYLQFAGVPDSVYNFTASRNDYTDDYASRGRWVNYLTGGSFVNPENPGFGIPLHLSLAFHTDAGTTMNDSIIGTLAIYTDHDNNKNKIYHNGASRQIGRHFTDLTQTQIVNDIRATFAPEWSRRHLMNSSYAESRNPEIPNFLLELLSHQNFADMRYGLDPRFRFVVSRAIYKGMLRFLCEQEGINYVVQPLPVQQFKMYLPTETTLRLCWQETVDTLEETAHPTYYVVYTRQDDGDWDNGIRVEAAEYELALQKGVRYDFKVRAGNAGGVSFPSEVLSAYIAPEAKGKVLILNNFTRISAAESFTIDSTYAGFAPNAYSVPYGKEVNFIGSQFDFNRNHPWVSDDDCGFGSCYADQAKELMAGNTFDYPVLHGQVLAHLGYTYISASAHAITEIDSTFTLVDVICGKQKQVTVGTEKQVIDFDIFTPQLAKALTDFTNHNGHILMSGAYLGSEVFKTAYGSDYKDFAKSVLHYTYRTVNATHSGNVRFVGDLKGAANDMLITMPNTQMLHIENPEGLTPVNGAKVVARYQDSEISAAISYDGTQAEQTSTTLKPAYKVLVFAFPLECLVNFNETYSSAIDWLAK